MKKRLKNKTELRAEIKERVGNTGWLDNIWVDTYGNWSIHSTGTICPDEEKYTFGLFARDYGESLDKAISKGFTEMEEWLNE